MNRSRSKAFKATGPIHVSIRRVPYVTNKQDQYRSSAKHLSTVSLCPTFTNQSTFTRSSFIASIPHQETKEPVFQNTKTRRSVRCYRDRAFNAGLTSTPKDLTSPEKSYMIKSENPPSDSQRMNDRSKCYSLTSTQRSPWQQCDKHRRSLVKDSNERNSPCSSLWVIYLVFLGVFSLIGLVAFLVAWLTKPSVVETAVALNGTILTRSTTSSTSATMTTTTVTTSMLSIGGSDPIVGLWNTTAGQNGTQATPGTAVGNYVASEPPQMVFDNNCGTKYTSFGSCDIGGSTASIHCGLGTGFHVTLLAGPMIVKSFRICTGNDAPPRDPLTMTLEGSNQTGSALFLGSSWRLIYNGWTGLATNPGRQNYGPVQNFASNTMAYRSYRILITSKRASDSALQYSEIQLFT